MSNRIHVHVYDATNPAACGWLGVILPLLDGPRVEYPGFNMWFTRKIIPGLFCGERTVLLSEYHDSIAGISILKKDSRERKICTFYVVDHFRGVGVGNALMEKSIYLLNTQSPMLTVPSTQLNRFKKILARYDFKQVEALRDYYRDGITEFVFNHPLSI